MRKWSLLLLALGCSSAEGSPQTQNLRDGEVFQVLQVPDAGPPERSSLAPDSASPVASPDAGRSLQPGIAGAAAPEPAEPQDAGEALQDAATPDAAEGGAEPGFGTCEPCTADEQCLSSHICAFWRDGLYCFPDRSGDAAVLPCSREEHLNATETDGRPFCAPFDLGGAANPTCELWRAAAGS